MVHNKAQIENSEQNGYSTDETNDDVAANSFGYGLTDVCTHVAKSCEIGKIKKVLKNVGVLNHCMQCEKEFGTGAGSPPLIENELESCVEFDETLWICLKCGSQLCGRNKNKHALAHYQKDHSDDHDLVMDLTFFTVWCYKCDLPVNPNSKMKLHECVEYIKREAKKSVQSLEKNEVSVNVSSGIDLIEDSNASINNHQTVNVLEKPALNLESLPRVRGLSNLGNTCFFNAVLQCLSQTPFLLEILNESSEPGEKFQLPGGILKMDNGEEVFLKPIDGELNSWGNLTNILANTLKELQSGGGVYTPKDLLKQLTAKWPQFAGGDQHDSHELLRHLLESVRCEDLRRYQSVILKLLGCSSKSDPQTVEKSVKQKIKFYGEQVQDRILRPEQVFRGFLVSTLTCQDCFNTSSRHEYFLDISLPISAEKPHYVAHQRRKPSPEPMSKSQAKKEKKRRARTQNAKNSLAATRTQKENNFVNAKEQSSSAGEQTDGDVEDNLIDDSVDKKCDKNGNADKDNSCPEIEPLLNDCEKQPINVNNQVVELGISSTGVNSLIKQTAEKLEKANIKDEDENERKTTRRNRTLSTADWSTTLAPRYQCEDGECSIQSCLNNFTWVELMTGANKVTCDNCTARINGKDGKPIYTNATKQLLISSPPAVLILHLKRFQVGPRGMFRKITKHVTFPPVLDIAPFCGSKVKRLPNIKPHTKKLPYSLYGVVEHSGTMHGGHYVAYVKVRPKSDKSDDPRWQFLPQGSKAELDQEDEQKLRLERSVSQLRESDESDESSSSEDGAVGGSDIEPDPAPLPGKWYYVSDSRVQNATEKEVLNSQAYLLFYERIDTN